MLSTLLLLACGDAEVDTGQAVERYATISVYEVDMSPDVGPFTLSTWRPGCSTTLLRCHLDTDPGGCSLTTGGSIYADTNLWASGEIEEWRSLYPLVTDVTYTVTLICPEL